MSKDSWILALAKKNRERKQKLLCCVGGGDEKYTGPTTDVSWNGGSVTSHKMELFIISLPPKQGTKHDEDKTYYWSVCPKRKLGKEYPKHSKSICERDTPITWDFGTGIYLHSRKIKGLCD